MAVTTQEPITTTRWTIDPSHSAAELAVRHMLVSTTRGRFGKLSGSIAYDPSNVAASSVEAEIDAASIETHDEKRDAHLRSPDFLDVETYPTIAFKSRRVESAGSDRFNVVGDLTIRGVTREVVLDTTYEGQANDPWGNTRAGFTATTRVNRMDFGAKWNVALETGGFLVGEEVRITLEIEALKQ